MEKMRSELKNISDRLKKHIQDIDKYCTLYHQWEKGYSEEAKKFKSEDKNVRADLYEAEALEYRKRVDFLLKSSKLLEKVLIKVNLVDDWVDVLIYMLPSAYVLYKLSQELMVYMPILSYEIGKTDQYMRSLVLRAYDETKMDIDFNHAKREADKIWREVME